jgi:hypothetical protein
MHHVRIHVHICMYLFQIHTRYISSYPGYICMYFAHAGSLMSCLGCCGSVAPALFWTQIAGCTIYYASSNWSLVYWVRLWLLPSAAAHVLPLTAAVVAAWSASSDGGATRAAPGFSEQESKSAYVILYSIPLPISWSFYMIPDIVADIVADIVQEIT